MRLTGMFGTRHLCYCITCYHTYLAQLSDPNEELQEVLVGYVCVLDLRLAPLHLQVSNSRVWMVRKDKDKVTPGFPVVF